MARTIVLVGQCGFDGPMLASEIQSILGSVQIQSCNNSQQLQEVCNQGADLVLFNRELNFDFADSSGIEAIRQLKAEHPQLKMMLVSDYPDAQAEAVAAGAWPGFGKAEVGSPKVGQAIGQAFA